MSDYYENKYIENHFFDVFFVYFLGLFVVEKSSNNTHTLKLSYSLYDILSFRLRRVPSYNFRHLGSPTRSIALGSYLRAAA